MHLSSTLSNEIGSCLLGIGNLDGENKPFNVPLMCKMKKRIGKHRIKEIPSDNGLFSSLHDFKLAPKDFLLYH